VRVTFNNASDYRTNRLYRTPNPNPNPNPSQWHRQVLVRGGAQNSEKIIKGRHKKYYKMHAVNSDEAILFLGRQPTCQNVRVCVALK